MTVFGKIVVVAAIAGLAAGALETVAHHFGTAAIIAKAEVFEKAADQAQGGSAPSAGAGGSMAGMPMVGMPQDGATWEPKEGFQRSALTALSDILKDIGFALLLAAAYTLSGREVDAAGLSAAAVRHLERQTGWRVQPGDWTEDEREAAAEQAAKKHTTETWNLKR